jgi:hypothetical protein
LFAQATILTGVLLYASEYLTTA